MIKPKRYGFSAGKYKIILFCCLALCVCRPAFGETVETKYFTISLCDTCDLSLFAEKINATGLFRIDALSSSGNDIRSVIKDGVDSLFLEVCDALDIALKSYRGRIIVYPDMVEVSEVASGNSQIIEANLPSIYVPSHNTIYISFRDATAGMLAHEMAHAVISTFFVVAPPPRVQEILAGYVEYSVRKKMGSLPDK